MTSSSTLARGCDVVDLPDQYGVLAAARANRSRRASGRLGRSERWLVLFAAMQRPQGLGAAEARQLCGVTQRQLRRDVRDLGRYITVEKVRMRGSWRYYAWPTPAARTCPLGTQSPNGAG